MEDASSSGVFTQAHYNEWHTKCKEEIRLQTINDHCNLEEFEFWDIQNMEMQDRRNDEIARNYVIPQERIPPQNQYEYHPRNYQYWLLQ